MSRVEKTWAINSDPVEKGIAMLKDGQDPLLKSLTVRYPGEEEKVYDSGERRKSASKTYIRIIQILIANVEKDERIKNMLVKEGYALEEEKYLELGLKKRSWYRELSVAPYPELPEIYVHKNLSTKNIAKNLKAIVASLEATWHAAGEKFPELEALCEVNDKLDVNDETGADEETGVDEERQDKYPFDLNTILFGPPGTGKTYRSRTYAVAIAEDVDPDWVEENLPYKNEEGKDSICGRYEKLEKEGRVRMVTFHQAYGYEEFIQGIRPVMKKKGTAEDEGNQQNLSYEIRAGAFTEFCEKAAGDLGNRYVFLIDEINRGNIAKIFGELITLIEPSKRKGAEEELSVRLPYDGERFSVPENVYLLGTMNTADRSLALLDTALRRRFDFVEMMPDPALLSGVVVEGIDVKTLLENLNNRLELLVDREHTIGHAFFLPLKKDPSIENLARIMKQKVIPLLQEFFYDDYGLLGKALGKVIVEKRDLKDLREYLEKDSRKLGERYTINYEALTDSKAYQELLSKGTNANG